MNDAKPDLLYGLASIGQELGLSERQALHQHEKGMIPTFKLGRTVCARRSALAAHFRALEARSTADA